MKMEDREILQAILEKVTSMDARLGTVESDMTGVKQDLAGVKQDLASVKQDLADVKQRTTKIEITLENDIKTQLNLLTEGQQGMNDKFKQLDQVAEDVEDIKDTVNVLEAVTKTNTTQIKELRIAK